MASGQSMARGVSVNYAGQGVIHAYNALTVTMPSQSPWTPCTGTGSLETARGGVHLNQAGVDLVGEKDIFGAPFDSTAMAAQEGSATS